jgi:hypothetical protein
MDNIQKFQMKNEEHSIVQLSYLEEGILFNLLATNK